MTSLEKDVSSALRIDDVDKPAQAATETPAIDVPAIPTTPEAPTPETFAEADTHAAASQPLEIAPQAQPQPAPQVPEPATPDILKDAKAS
jgi:sec-independent protein translocase protein TatB